MRADPATTILMELAQRAVAVRLARHRIVDHVGRHGPIVGSIKVSCTHVSGHLWNCNATATFTSPSTGIGEIFVSGTVNLNKNHFFIPITGGTGDFAGATGQVERTGLGGNLELLVFHLR